jgi:sigma-B regulation protein RsbU (phosphoserine phosphatase)
VPVYVFFYLNGKRHARDMAALIDEKLMAIQNITILVSGKANETAYNPQDYKPKELPLLGDNQPVSGSRNTYLYLSAGINRQAAVAESRIAANISDIFKYIHDMNGDITASYIAGESGYFIITRKDDFLVFNNYDGRERVWYKAAKNANALVWSNLYVDTSGIPAITCAAPYYGRGPDGKKTLKGVAGNGVTLDKFTKIIDVAAPGQNTTVFLLNEEGIKLFSSDGSGAKINSAGEVSGEKPGLSSNDEMRKFVAVMMARESKVMEVNIDGELHYAACHPLNTINWSMGVITGSAEINMPLQTLTGYIQNIAKKTLLVTDHSIFIMLCAFALVTALVLSYRVWSVFAMSRRIVEPVSNLARQVAMTGAGDLVSDVKVNSRIIEILQLAGAFNKMKKRLRDHIERLSFTTAEKQKMSSELEIAAKIQRAVLPFAALPPPKKNGAGLEADAVMYPAKEVGGDLYDFFFIDGIHFAIVMGDVSGKGISAAMLMLVVNTLVKTHLQDGVPVAAAVDKVNLHICGGNYPGMFVTLWVGVLNTQTKELEYVNAGHTMPLLRFGNSEFKYIQTKNHDIVVGVMDGFKYNTHKINLKQGDALFLYTDGITEAFDRNKNMYGEERLRSYINKNGALQLKVLLPAIYDDIKSFTDGAEQSDDITMLMLRLP